MPLLSSLKSSPMLRVLHQHRNKTLLVCFAVFTTVKIFSVLAASLFRGSCVLLYNLIATKLPLPKLHCFAKKFEDRNIIPLQTSLFLLNHSFQLLLPHKHLLQTVLCLWFGVVLDCLFV